MKNFLLLASVLCVNLHASISIAQPVTQAVVRPLIHRLFIFGDSLSDIGNLQGRSFSIVPSTQNYFMGRFSDGDIWIDDLATDYGTTVKDHQFINDYAVGGATAFPYVNDESIFHL